MYDSIDRSTKYSMHLEYKDCLGQLLFTLWESEHHRRRRSKKKGRKRPHRAQQMADINKKQKDGRQTHPAKTDKMEPE